MLDISTKDAIVNQHMRRAIFNLTQVAATYTRVSVRAALAGNTEEFEKNAAIATRLLDICDEFDGDGRFTKTTPQFGEPV